MEPKNNPNQNLTQAETDSEQKRQEAVARFKNLTDKEPVKRTFLKKTGVRAAGVVLVAGALLSGAAYELGSHGIIDVPGIHQIIDVPSIYDNNAEINYIKAGVNAQTATEQQISDFLNTTPPVLEAPQPGNKNLPQIEMMLPVNPEHADSIKITKVYYVSPDDPEVTQLFCGFDISGRNVPFSIPLIEGAKTVDAKADCHSPGNVLMVDLRYHLNDGQVLIASMTFSDNRFSPTDILKNIPEYDANVQGNTFWLPDSVYQTFDLSKNPDLVLRHTSGKSEISLLTTKGDWTLANQFFLNNIFATDNNKALYPPIK